MYPLDIVTPLLELRYLGRDNWTKIFAYCTILEKQRLVDDFLKTKTNLAVTLY